MKQEDLQIIKKEIQELIQKLEGEIADLEANAQPVAPENAIGRISRMDAINNQSVLEASLRNRRRKLSKLRIALSNVDQPGFGICSSCGRNINPKRVMLMPESTRCIHCA